MRAFKFLNKAKIFSSILQAKITGKIFPLVVHINITNTCNLRCAYCYGRYSYRKGVRDFTTKELISLVDELDSLGTRIINLGAGEPLMRQDIEEIIAYIRAKDIECRMNTNGHLVSQRLAAVKKLSSICISIDGDEEAHDRYKGEGSFRKVLSAIDICRDNNIPVHTSTMLSKYNIYTIDLILELAKRKGFFAEFLLPFFQDPSLDFMASDSDYRQGLQKIIMYKKRGYPVFFSFKAHRHALNWPDYQKRSIRGEIPKGFGTYIPCFAGKYMCIIDSDGKVYPCSQMIEGYPTLNFREVGFKKSWEYIRNHNCRTCYAFICFNDYNLLLSLDPTTIFNHIRNSLWETFKFKHNDRFYV